MEGSSGRQSGLVMFLLFWSFLVLQLFVFFWIVEPFQESQGELGSTHPQSVPF